jgi:hypothetical protein
MNPEYVTLYAILSKDGKVITRTDSPARADEIARTWAGCEPANKYTVEAKNGIRRRDGSVEWLN